MKMTDFSFSPENVILLFYENQRTFHNTLASETWLRTKTVTDKNIIVSVFSVKVEDLVPFWYVIYSID